MTPTPQPPPQEIGDRQAQVRELRNRLMNQIPADGIHRPLVIEAVETLDSLSEASARDRVRIAELEIERDEAITNFKNAASEADYSHLMRHEIEDAENEKLKARIGELEKVNKALFSEGARICGENVMLNRENGGVSFLRLRIGELEKALEEALESIRTMGHCVCQFNGKGDVLEICAYHGRLETVICEFKNAFPNDELYKYPWLKSEIEGKHDGRRKQLWDTRMKYQLKHIEAKLQALSSHPRQPDGIGEAIENLDEADNLFNTFGGHWGIRDKIKKALAALKGKTA